VFLTLPFPITIDQFSLFSVCLKHVYCFQLGGIALNPVSVVEHRLYL